MKYFIAGVIGGIISVVMSLLWFLLGAIFTYGIMRDDLHVKTNH